MNDQENAATLTLCLMAAVADGTPSDIEQAELKRIAASLPGADAAKGIEDVLLGRRSLEQTAAQITQPQDRQAAFEMAASVCAADASLNAQERAFLTQLASALHLPGDALRSIEQSLPNLHAGSLSESVAPVPPPAAASEIDKSITQYAILAGALELLPQTLSTLAILPLQMKMIYQIGKAYGYDLDRGHVKDFLATAGLGLSSQVVESYARRLVKGVVKSVAGSLAGSIASQSTSSALAFATTYGIGHLAKRYYAGGRTLSGSQLRDAFGSLQNQARSIELEYLPQIRERARTLNLRTLLKT